MIGFTRLAGQVQINELMASNAGFISDPVFNDYSDWIELHNPSSQAVAIGGYYVSDSRNTPRKWQVPDGTSIAPGGYLLLWADGRDSGLYTNFNLSAEGEFLSIHDSSGELVDSVNFPPQRSNISYGRKRDGTAGWYYFTEPTPGTANSDDGYTGYAEAPRIATEAGFYSGAVEVSLHPAANGETYRYTLDGAIPEINSQAYTGPLNFSKTTVFRVRAFRDNFLPSEIVNATFFINAPDHTIPVFSISSAPANFFDPDSGMFIHYQAEKGIEIPIGIEFFEQAQQVFQINAGSEIYGGATRGFAQKSLDIKFRTRYGPSSLNYRLFPGNPRSNFTSFILRNSGNDWSDSGNWLGTMFCDGLQQSIIEGRMDIDMQSYRPAAVYINGEYWGILNIREKLDGGYAAWYHGHDPDSLDMIKLGAGELINIQRGDSHHFEEVVEFIENNDMSEQANYSYICTQVDVSEFMNYQIVQNFIANIDWPHNNMRFYRPATEGGRWRWMLYDLDFGFNGFMWTSWPIWTGYTKNMYPDAINPEMGKWSYEVFRGLINNQEFVNEFVQRYAHHLNTTFKPSRTLMFVDSLKQQVSGEMPRHIARWKNFGATSSYTSWENNIKKFVQFAEQRPGYAWRHTMDQFNLKDTTTLVLSIINPAGGNVTLNDIPLEHENLNGRYFKNIPIRLMAKARPGFRFTGWTGDVDSDEEELTISISKHTAIQAVFIEISYGLSINELCASNTSTIADEYGEYDDWVEIFNYSDNAIDLGGLYLTDSFSSPLKFMIPESDPEGTTVAPGGYILFWLDNQTHQGVRHVDFALSREGEQIALVMKDGDAAVFIDSLSFPVQSNDVTYGRFPDGGDDFYYFVLPTPLAANDTTGLTTSIFEKPDSREFVLYPNPASGSVFVKHTDEISNIFGEQVWLEIVAVSGNVIRSGYVSFTNHFELDVSGIRNGLYFIKIRTGKGLFTSRIVIAGD